VFSGGLCREGNRLLEWRREVQSAANLLENLSSFVEVSRKLLWLKHGDSSGTQKKGIFCRFMPLPEE
jgi:hypothetical protein